MTSPKNANKVQSRGTSFRNYASPNSKAQTMYVKGFTSGGGKELNTSQSAFMSPASRSSPEKSKQVEVKDVLKGEDKPFMHKRLGPNSDPTCMSTY